MLQTNYASTLLPTLILTWLLTKRSIPAGGPALPVLINLLRRLLTSFVRDTTLYDRLFNTQADLQSIRGAVGTVFVSSALFQYPRFDIIAGLLHHPLQLISPANVLRWVVNEPIFVGAIFTALLLYKDLKEARMLKSSWVVVLGTGLLVLIFVGPGATLMAGWLWREEILATRRHWAAITEAE